MLYCDAPRRELHPPLERTRETSFATEGFSATLRTRIGGILLVAPAPSRSCPSNWAPPFRIFVLGVLVVNAEIPRVESRRGWERGERSAGRRLSGHGARATSPPLAAATKISAAPAPRTHALGHPTPTSPRTTHWRTPKIRAGEITSRLRRCGTRSRSTWSVCTRGTRSTARRTFSTRC